MQFKVLIWSSCKKENARDALFECFGEELLTLRYKLRGQELCKILDYKLSDIPRIPRSSSGEKPIFLKVLKDLLIYIERVDGTVMIDDTRYKHMYNPLGSCIFPPSFDPEDIEQDPYYLSNTLIPWLENWRLSKQPIQYVLHNMIENPKDTVSAFVIRHHNKRSRAKK